jgi:hypothetical protein
MTRKNNVIRLRNGSKVLAPPRGTRVAEFAQATLDAEAFFAACRARWDRRTLRTLSKKLSPLAVEILLRKRDQMAAAKSERHGNANT